MATKVFFVFLLPWITIAPGYVTLRGREKVRYEKLYSLQAHLGVGLVVVLCLLTALFLTGVVFWGNYEEPRGEDGHQPVPLRPYQRSLSYHVQNLFQYVSVILLIVSALGLLVPVPEDTAKEEADKQTDRQQPSSD